MNSMKREQSFDDSVAPGAHVSSFLDRSSAVNPPATKKRKVKPNVGKLSFAADDEDGGGVNRAAAVTEPKVQEPQASGSEPTSDHSVGDGNGDEKGRHIGANKLAGFVPKVLTKSGLRREAEQREALREEFRKKQETVKNTPIVVPFVFFEGTNTVTGRVRLKKGDTVDVLLSGAQKIVVKQDYKKWVHLKLDDLMLVRGGIMIPHYLTIHYFILKGTKGPQGTLFDHTSEPPTDESISQDESVLEGADHDPNLTKIVDVKWYQDHKHIYPCNMWELYDTNDVQRDYSYSKTARRDAHGNSFFS